MREWLDDDQRAILLENGQLDLLCRWRKTSDCAAVRSHNGKYFSGVTAVTFALPAARTAWPPPVLPELLKSENGLILVTGRRGAANLPRWRRWLAISINIRCAYSDAGRSCGISLYQSASLIQQREIGLHCMTFASGLRLHCGKILM